jgi:hypothetical protein
MSLESTSSLASSSELRKSKDLELWGLIKDVNELIDAETGTVYSVKKFKVLMKLFEDYGWEPTNYITEQKQPVPIPTDQGMPSPAGEAPAISPEVPPLAGNQLGAVLGNAVKQ